MSKEQTDWVLVPRADAEDARDLLRLYGNNADWAALAARFDKHCAVPPEPQAVAVAWWLRHHNENERLSLYPITDGDRSLGWTDTPLYASPSPAGGVQGVTVKALEWVALVGSSSSYADTGFGPRYIVYSSGWKWSWGIPGQQIEGQSCASETEAKAAAQSDYAQRILSALKSGAPDA